MQSVASRPAIRPRRDGPFGSGMPCCPFPPQAGTPSGTAFLIHNVGQLDNLAKALLFWGFHTTHTLPGEGRKQTREEGTQRNPSTL